MDAKDPFERFSRPEVGADDPYLAARRINRQAMLDGLARGRGFPLDEHGEQIPAVLGPPPDHTPAPYPGQLREEAATEGAAVREAVPARTITIAGKAYAIAPEDGPALTGAMWQALSRETVSVKLASGEDLPVGPATIDELAGQLAPPKPRETSA